MTDATQMFEDAIGWLVPRLELRPWLVVLFQINARDRDGGAVRPSGRSQHVLDVKCFRAGGQRRVFEPP